MQGAPVPDGGRTVEFRALSKRYHGRWAVEELSFAVAPGRVTGFLGPNGAGKTTTLRMLLGLTAPTSGTATVGGRAYRDLEQPLRTVGAMLDESGTLRRRTGCDHLRVQRAATGLPARRADEVLDQVGLARAGGRRYEEYPPNPGRYSLPDHRPRPHAEHRLGQCRTQ